MRDTPPPAGVERRHVRSQPIPGLVVSGISGLVASLRALWISPPEIRAEAWALGGRHQGRVLEGARAEAKAPDISFRRAILLKAVIRSVR
jgi:hypothetical protein